MGEGIGKWATSKITPQKVIQLIIFGVVAVALLIVLLIVLNKIKQKALASRRREHTVQNGQATEKHNVTFIAV